MREVTDSAEDVIVVREVRLAVLAAVDARGVEVYVICEAHDDGYVIGRACRGRGKG